MSPPSGATYSIDPTLRREFQALSFRAVTGTPTSVTWRVDGRLIATAASDEPVAWPLVVGEHAIEARDGSGHLVRTTITVR